MTYMAKVTILKEVAHDNFETGCSTNSWYTCSEEAQISFTDQNDFIEELALYLSLTFDIDRDDFERYVGNRDEPNVFEYNQTENGEAERMVISEENPDGYLANYTIVINYVYEKTTFNWEVIRNEQ